MKILYCNKYNYAFSGTEVYLFEVMEQMRDSGHQVALFSMADSRGTPTEYNHYLVPPVDFKSGGVITRARLSARAIYSRDARLRLRDMIADFQPDVAHVRNIYHHLTPSILWELKSHGIPVLYHLNDFKLLCPSYNMVSHGHACERCQGSQFWHVITEGCYTESRASSLVLAAEAYIHKWLGTYPQCVDRFLAPSHFVRQKLMEQGWQADKIEVLPHFQRIPARYPEASTQDAPILYFGRLSPEKGVTNLLLAMQNLPHIRLDILGDGPSREPLEKMAVALGIGNVQFLGHIPGPALDQHIAASQFTVFPSHAYETLGKSILESYAQGRAVVASDLGSRREFVREGKTGLLFKPGDVAQLTTSIAFLSDHPEISMQMGQAGRRLLAECHSPENYLRNLTDLYEEIREHSQTSRRWAGVDVLQTLRVAFIGGRGVVSKYSGIEACYEETGRRLVNMGHEITVYCRTYFTPPQSKYRGMRLVRLPTIRTKHLETFVHTLLSTLHAMFGPYDIVHYQALGPALFSFLPRLTGKKTIVTVQGLDWQRGKWGRFASFILRVGEWAAIHFPNQTVVVSQTLQKHFQERLGAATTYIPNGTSLLKQRPPIHLADWGLRSREYILYLGRFSPEKKCHLLIEAYKKINTTMKLVLAGGSSHSDQYADDLRRNQSDRILLLDWVSGEPLDELLTHAAVFVLPSDMEGLSLALLDAMGAGVCVLASNVPENLEAMESFGFSFRRGDSQDLENMLRLLLSNPNIRRDAGRRAQAHVRKHYLWRDVTRSLEQAYRNTLTPPATPIANPNASSYIPPRRAA